MNKYVLRIPAEQFAFIEAHIEGEHDDAVHEYRRLTEMVKGNAGLSGKEWHDAVESYMNEQGTTPEVFERMNEKQQFFLKEIDRYLARKNYKNSKSNIHHSLQDNS